MKWIVFAVFVACLSSCDSTSEQRTNEIDNTPLLPGELEFFRTPVNYTLMCKGDSMYRTMAFYKHQDSTVFSSFNYQLSVSQPVILREEVKTIDALWNIAKDSIEIKLKSVMVGYPLEYEDVLFQYINDFIELSDSLPINSESSGTLVKSILKSSAAYAPMDSILELQGYRVNNYYTEKHGQVPSERLTKLGFDKDLEVPIPFIVWMEVVEKDN